MYKLLCLFVAIAAFMPDYTFASPKIVKDSSPSTIVIHANNSMVPNDDITYIVDAVESLKEAVSLYVDDNDRLKAYVELYQIKHPEKKWNAVVGYTALCLKASYYVETTISETGKNVKASSKDDKKPKNVHSLLFSSD